MSNSIWKKPDQKPDQDQQILFFAGDRIFPYVGFYYPTFDLFEDRESKDVQKWCDIDDLIAQADKAERLQKAVDLALNRLHTIATAHHPTTTYYNLDAQTAIDEIKQLIKGE